VTPAITLADCVSVISPHFTAISLIISTLPFIMGDPADSIQLIRLLNTDFVDATLKVRADDQALAKIRSKVIDFTLQFPPPVAVKA